ncbi:PadR family transcriptional regulator [Streptomyces sp. NPDC047117]|uniref:PadR family transcriptional regulator n=1 Tax=unclassified Streptomyces TaxID=2593676 RepID=UPI0033FDD977
MAVNEGLRQQWLRGVLDMCLLAVIAQRPTYGYEMTVRLAEHGLEVASGSIYPALARLRSRGLVDVTRQPGAGGPVRTYYHLAADGRRELAEWSAQWADFAAGVDRVLPITTNTTEQADQGHEGGDDEA